MMSKIKPITEARRDVALLWGCYIFGWTVPLRLICQLSLVNSALCCQTAIRIGLKSLDQLASIPSITIKTASRCFEPRWFTLVWCCVEGLLIVIDALAGSRTGVLFVWWMDGFSIMTGCREGAICFFLSMLCCREALETIKRFPSQWLL